MEKVPALPNACKMTSISEKRMAASRLYLRTGCMVHSATSLGSSSNSKKFLDRIFLYSIYSGKWRPAWRKTHYRKHFIKIIQQKHAKYEGKHTTGVFSTFSPRAALIIRSFSKGYFVDMHKFFTALKHGFVTVKPKETSIVIATIRTKIDFILDARRSIQPIFLKFVWSRLICTVKQPICYRILSATWGKTWGKCCYYLEGRRLSLLLNSIMLCKLKQIGNASFLSL